MLTKIERRYVTELHRYLLSKEDNCLNKPPKGWDAHFSGVDPFNPQPGELEWVYHSVHMRLTGISQRKHKDYKALSSREYNKRMSSIHSKRYREKYPERHKEHMRRYELAHRPQRNAEARRRYWLKKNKQQSQLKLDV